MFLLGGGFKSADHFARGVLVSFICFFLGVNAWNFCLTSIRREHFFKFINMNVCYNFYELRESKTRTSASVI
jgi:hypothetical protein